MYYYLVSSLPDLAFGKTAPMSVAEFDALCAGQLTPADFAELGRGTLVVSREPGSGAALPGVYRRYTLFEQYLRTRIAEKRTAHDDDHGRKLPVPEQFFTEVDAALTPAGVQSDPLEREKAVDRIRWRHLDELEAGHDFDLDKLCVYRLKLAILDKYRNRETEAGRKNFNAAVDRISGLPSGEEKTEKAN